MQCACAWRRTCLIVKCLIIFAFQMVDISAGGGGELLYTNNIRRKKTYDMHKKDYYYRFGSPLGFVDIQGDNLSIGNGAFSCCENLTRVVMHEGVVSIGTNAFGQWKNLAVDIPASVITIGWISKSPAESGIKKTSQITYCGTMNEWKTLGGCNLIAIKPMHV